MDNLQSETKRYVKNNRNYLGCVIFRYTCISLGKNDMGCHQEIIFSKKMEGQDIHVKANKEKENETRVPRRFTKHKCVITEDIKSGFKNQTYRGGWLHLANR